MSRVDWRSFPFSAIVGQDALKTALLLNAVDPRVGGVLVRGQKGTAKSTAVRAMANILPEFDVIDGCAYGCDPEDSRRWCSSCMATEGQHTCGRRKPHLVDLPVSATEDRVVGTLDLEHALKQGERRYEPGLLAEANRGILYVDEVNLLDDHLVDTLLDAAASGVNVVEREGVRFQHPARFILVGTMNPEEGEIRPQLLDRFGLCVDVEGIADAQARVEIMRRRRAFEDDPELFGRKWETQERALTERIERAQHRLPDVELDDDLLFLIASVCSQIGVDGHRADLTMARAATAYALLHEGSDVTAADIRHVAPMVLAHRMKRTPFEQERFSQEQIAAMISAPSDGGGEDADGKSESSRGPVGDTDTHPEIARTLVEGALIDDADGELSTPMSLDLDRIRRSQGGRRQETTSDDRRGRYVRSEAPRAGDTPDIALDATIRAAAPFQSSREGDMAILIEAPDIRNKVRRRRVGASIVFCVDASGSMGAQNRMEIAKSAVLELLVDAYQRRDRVGLVAFRGEGADLVLSPTGSVELAQLKLRSLLTGGATPLAHGILKSLEVLQLETRRNDDIIPWLVLVTDGRGNVGVDGGLGSEDAKSAAGRVREARVNTIVIDTTHTSRSGGAARNIAQVAGGEYVRLASMDGGALSIIVRERLRTA
ncbi:MAG: magnesium chelatase subunit D family protein [Coriobacteriia bacterium]|nr:magnesium chelatase subunit D family protein [Coriobacteriia bacterium]